VLVVFIVAEFVMAEVFLKYIYGHNKQLPLTTLQFSPASEDRTDLCCGVYGMGLRVGVGENGRTVVLPSN
jgi:hypothetical protein